MTDMMHLLVGADSTGGLTIDGLNCRIVAENDKLVVIYVPGRSKYIDSASGTQYSPSEYIICLKDWSRKAVENTLGILVEEVLRFNRSI